MHKNIILLMHGHTRSVTNYLYNVTLRANPGYLGFKSLSLTTRIYCPCYTLQLSLFICLYLSVCLLCLNFSFHFCRLLPFYFLCRMIFVYVLILVCYKPKFINQMPTPGSHIKMYIHWRIYSCYTLYMLMLYCSVQILLLIHAGARSVWCSCREEIDCSCELWQSGKDMSSKLFTKPALQSSTIGLHRLLIKRYYYI